MVEDDPPPWYKWKRIPRVSVVAIGKWREYPEYPGAKATPQSYMPKGNGSGVAWFDVMRCRVPNTACDRRTNTTDTEKPKSWPTIQSNLTQGDSERRLRQEGQEGQPERRPPPKRRPRLCHRPHGGMPTEHLEQRGGGPAFEGCISPPKPDRRVWALVLCYDTLSVQRARDTS
jgi:hypothetical protein